MNNREFIYFLFNLMFLIGIMICPIAIGGRVILTGIVGSLEALLYNLMRKEGVFKWKDMN